MSNGRTLPPSALVLLTALLLLTACHRDSSDSPLDIAPVHVNKAAMAKRGPTPEELTVGMVEAATMGKSTVPVTVKFDLGVTPVVGEAIDVEIAVLPQIAADKISLQMLPSDGLSVTAGNVPIEFAPVDPAHVYRHTVNLVPNAEGVLLLDFSVSITHDEITETRAFALPMIVGPTANEAAASATSAAAP